MDSFICYADVYNAHNVLIGNMYVNLESPYGWVYVAGPIDIPKPDAFKTVASKQEVYDQTKQWAQTNGYTLGPYACPTNGKP